MFDYEGLVSGRALSSTATIRKKTWYYDSIFPELLKRYENEGWEIDKEFKTKIRVMKPKSHDVMFEDQVWSMFADMGFSQMNADRTFKLTYDEKDRLSQQIDVFAADEETVLLVECKSAQEIQRKHSFKETIDAIGAKKGGFLSNLRRHDKGKRYRTRIIFATRNYIISDVDKERLDKYKIYHMQEEEIDYYCELTRHLGTAARYQLLGNLFHGDDIPGLDTEIPAIKGTMGGHVFYSFSLEPAKLLKIGYVLHRNNANRNSMPTYQRLVKKSRLQSINHFVEKGGYFPNSVVINIDNKGKELKFDLSGLQNDSSLSRLGIVHLPKKYRSAYIIDGQHRLYGYADTKYEAKNTIPVVAFTNLSQDEQSRLFMEINENQKSVSKNLRNTLIADLYWTSEIVSKRMDALKNYVAQRLGEDKASPLYDRVIIGENEKTRTRVITMDFIKRGLDQGNLLGQFKDKKTIKAGPFFAGSNDDTVKQFYPFLLSSLQYIADNSDSALSESGILNTNPGINSIIRLLSDIVELLVKQEVIKPLSDPVSSIIKEVAFYLDPVIHYIDGLSSEEQQELRKSYGSGAPVKMWRTWQREIELKRELFKPEGLLEYWEDNSRKYNKESFELLQSIEEHMKNDFRVSLEAHYGQNWFVSGVPKKVYDEANKLANDKNYEDSNKHVEPWDCLLLIHYRQIAVHGSNWRDIFEAKYTRPKDKKKGGNKEAKTEWIVEVNKIRNNLFHNYSIAKADNEFLREVCNWLIG